jgi:2,4-dienoyl-CoA reductase (NADPH2)
MGSMHTRLEQTDQSLARQAAFYAARAAGGAALIVTGGYSPNSEGRLEPGGPVLDTDGLADELRSVTDAVHSHDAKILLQILHAGRYAKHDQAVGPSAIRSPINPQIPRALTANDVARTLDDFVRCAHLARRAGFDGVELMGSEGYLINQFTAPRTNVRTDKWGVSLENRCRFPVELTRRVRKALGPDFLIMYRISAIDLVDDGLTGAEIDYLASAVEAAGADILNTGYGWHEAKTPTIAYHVPRAAWTFGAARLKRAVSIPVIASNRINTPETAESILARGDADLISMARPLLADPEFVTKASQGRSDEITPCIACNQSCLDHIFTERVATCLVNPRACRETEFGEEPPAKAMRVAVVGSGPAGLSAAVEAARRGHRVTLFEAQADVGGQLNLARRIPGKQEFDGLIRYFRRQLQLLSINVHTATRFAPEHARAEAFEHVVVATGIVPRVPQLAGIEHQKVVGYIDVIEGRVEVGNRVAILGAGGIAHDVAELLVGGQAHDVETFLREWGIDPTISQAGGCIAPTPQRPVREIYMLQRSPGRSGSRLGKSTGWILRSRLKRNNVHLLSGVTYRRVDDQGLHITTEHGDSVLAVDTIVICAGQESDDQIVASLRKTSIPFDVIGGARLSAELDAARAIEEGTRVAQALGEQESKPSKAVTG